MRKLRATNRAGGSLLSRDRCRGAMKIIFAAFQSESNSFCKTKAEMGDFDVSTGPRVPSRLAAVEVFHIAGYSPVPAIFASAHPLGVVSREAFDEVPGIVFRTVRDTSDAGGVYLYLHGAMQVAGLGSGSHTRFTDGAPKCPPRSFAGIRCAPCSVRNPRRACSLRCARFSRYTKASSRYFARSLPLRATRRRTATSHACDGPLKSGQTSCGGLRPFARGLRESPA